jgi:hypothetical protein
VLSTSTYEMSPDLLSGSRMTKLGSYLKAMQGSHLSNVGI